MGKRDFQEANEDSELPTSRVEISNNELYSSSEGSESNSSNSTVSKAPYISTLSAAVAKKSARGGDPRKRTKFPEEEVRVLCDLVTLFGKDVRTIIRFKPFSGGRYSERQIYDKVRAIYRISQVSANPTIEDIKRAKIELGIAENLDVESLRSIKKGRLSTLNGTNQSSEDDFSSSEDEELNSNNNNNSNRNGNIQQVIPTTASPQRSPPHPSPTNGIMVTSSKRIITPRSPLLTPTTRKTGTQILQENANSILSQIESQNISTPINSINYQTTTTTTTTPIPESTTPTRALRERDRDKQIEREKLEKEKLERERIERNEQKEKERLEKLEKRNQQKLLEQKEKEKDIKEQQELKLQELKQQQQQRLQERLAQQQQRRQRQKEQQQQLQLIQQQSDSSDDSSSSDEEMNNNNNNNNVNINDSGRGNNNNNNNINNNNVNPHVLFDYFSNSHNVNLYKKVPSPTSSSSTTMITSPSSSCSSNNSRYGINGLYNPFSSALIPTSATANTSAIISSSILNSNNIHVVGSNNFFRYETDNNLLIYYPFIDQDTVSNSFTFEQDLLTLYIEMPDIFDWIKDKKSSNNNDTHQTIKVEFPHPGKGYGPPRKVNKLPGGVQGVAFIFEKIKQGNVDFDISAL